MTVGWAFWVLSRYWAELEAQATSRPPRSTRRPPCAQLLYGIGLLLLIDAHAIGYQTAHSDVEFLERAEARLYDAKEVVTIRRQEAVLVTSTTAGEEVALPNSGGPNSGVELPNISTHEFVVDTL